MSLLCPIQVTKALPFRSGAWRWLLTKTSEVDCAGGEEEESITFFAHAHASGTAK